MTLSDYRSSRPYPYLPNGQGIHYVTKEHPAMREALGLREPLLSEYPQATVTASVVVNDAGDVIGKGTNQPVHTTFCPRTAFRSPSGEGYDLCPDFCHDDNHSEASAIRDAAEKNHYLKGGSLYLAGHWWLCKPCWDKITTAGIINVYLPEGATEDYYREVSGKGEPTKKILLALSGAYADEELKVLLKQVNIELVGIEEADTVFTPPPGAATEDIVLALSRHLKNEGLYL